MWRQHRPGNRARGGVEAAEVWPTERAAAREGVCGLAPVANGLVAADDWDAIRDAAAY